MVVRFLFSILANTIERGNSIKNIFNKPRRNYSFPRSIFSARCFGLVMKKGYSKCSEYICWLDMKKRCFNSKCEIYKYYGGRGITVCDEWKNSFESFINYLGYKPSKNHSIDRIDVNGNYEPGNVRWATKTEQVRNRRVGKNNTSGCKGVTWDHINKKWMVRIYINKKCKNLGRFKTIEQAIEERKKAELKYWK